MPPNSNCLRTEGGKDCTAQKSSGGRPEKTAASFAGVSEYRNIARPTHRRAHTILAGGRCDSRRDRQKLRHESEAIDKNPVTTSGLIRFHDRLTKPEIR